MNISNDTCDELLLTLIDTCDKSLSLLNAYFYDAYDES